MEAVATAASDAAACVRRAGLAGGGESKSSCARVHGAGECVRPLRQGASSVWRRHQHRDTATLMHTCLIQRYVHRSVAPLARKER